MTDHQTAENRLRPPQIARSLVPLLWLWAVIAFAAGVAVTQLVQDDSERIAGLVAAHVGCR